MTTRAIERLREGARRASRLLPDSETSVALRGHLLRRYRRRRFNSFGRGSVLDRPVLLAGAHKISVGDHSAVLTGCWISAAPRTWRRPDPAIVIGDRVEIRPFCSISGAESVVIEDDVVIGSYSMIVDSHHRLDGPHDNPGRNPPVSAPIRIGRGTEIGERVAVLRGTSIGRHCVIATNSVVQGRIPDYSIARGAPARIVGTTRPGEPPAS